MTLTISQFALGFGVGFICGVAALILLAYVVSQSRK